MSRAAEIERGFEPLAGEAWRGVWTLPNMEKRVFRGLHDEGLSPFLPWDRTTEIIRGRKVDVSRPLFTGYCFFLLADWSDEHWHAVHAIEGVGGILCQDGGPAIIPAMQLANRLYACILDEIKRVSPFRSERSKRREKARDRYLAKLLAC